VDWKPVDRATLDTWIADALARRDDAVRAAWAQIRIEPAKWQCSPMGDLGGGFWAVAIDGDEVLWFNDIEGGFNRSPFARRGVIAEYACNQDDFDVVLEGFAQAISEQVWAHLSPSSLPGELAGPGLIVAHQTTYWDLRTAAGATWRVHLRDPVESRVTIAAYSAIELVTAHPVLDLHAGAGRSLYFTGRALRPHLVADAVARAVRDASAGWRSLADHDTSVAGVASALAAGHGLLLRASETTCAAVAAVLEAAGVSASVVGAASAPPPLQALVAGGSFVIAEAFAFERTA
jgi:hypothetical protein